jgi:hypothetical protein
MPRETPSGSGRILRRIRAALVALDRDETVSAADRLDALYAIDFEITGRILALESPTEGTEEQPVSRWSPVRY